MMHRFFVDYVDISDKEIALTGENAAHGSVLRLAIDEEIVVCDGNAADYHCIVTKADKKEIRAKIIHKLENKAEPPIAITLFQALPKSGKMDEIIEKCTQLGISRIAPVLTSRCVTKAPKVDRWRKIAQAAAKQSQRGRIPRIGAIMALDDAIEEAEGYDSAFACYEAEEALLLKTFLKNLPKNISDIAFFVGPEGGFDAEEVNQFRESGIVTVSLGSRILRTEAAAPAVLVSILYELEELP